MNGAEEGHEPSYVGVSRCLSGYSSLKYDPVRHGVSGRAPSPFRVNGTPKPETNGQDTPGKLHRSRFEELREPEGCSSSFIVQRIERLYGPGALAQSFYARLTPSPRSSRLTPAEKPPTEDLSNSVPVMRLLSPEFRAQLRVSPKKLTFESPNGRESTTPPRIIIQSGLDVTDATPMSPPPGRKFLQLLDTQVTELERLATQTESIVNNAPDEESAGMLRATAGKARLLVAEKLDQFRGLCHKNLDAAMDEFPTTAEDLAGFWDMVMIQIKEVKKQFGEIDELRANGWKPIEPVPKPIPTAVRTNAAKKKPTTISKEQSEAAKARDAARRKMIQQKREQMKNAAATQKQNNDTNSATVLFL